MSALHPLGPHGDARGSTGAAASPSWGFYLDRIVGGHRVVAIPLVALKQGIIGEPPRAAAAWQRRVFRNSFTRQGQTYTAKGWAFKIQFQGHRRTFSLAGRTRQSRWRAPVLLRLQRPAWQRLVVCLRLRQLAVHLSG